MVDSKFGFSSASRGRGVTPSHSVASSGCSSLGVLRRKVTTLQGTLGHVQHIISGIIHTSQQQGHALPLLIIQIRLLEPFAEAAPLALQALELVELRQTGRKREAVLQLLPADAAAGLEDERRGACCSARQQCSPACVRRRGVCCSGSQHPPAGLGWREGMCAAGGDGMRSVRQGIVCSLYGS